MLTALLRSLRTGVVTTRYPDVPAAPPARFRGAPLIRANSRYEDLPPPSVCPSRAIESSADPQEYRIDLRRCIFCGHCAEQTMKGVIELGREVELAQRNAERLVIEVGCDDDGRTTQQPPPPSGEEVSQLIRRTLGRSLHLRHLDSGSCNACDWELTALLNPVYDIRRLGIDFVASPRHADGVIVTGPVTRNLRAAVERTFEAVPEPRIVVAVGACAASGGICGKSYASLGGVSEVLPVDVTIPGCPPRPEAIIFGILLSIGRLRQRHGAT